MGILRIYLALSVLAWHSHGIPPFSWFSGSEAVQIFFIISGFYMELVLTKKYADKKSFYVNRFLRIFIPYWICLGAVVVVCILCRSMLGNALAMQSYFDGTFAKNSAAGICLAAVSNITIFFMDIILFVNDSSGHFFHLCLNIRQNVFGLSHYVLIPQGWSVAVELCFYLCVPFLHKLKTSRLLLIAALSLCARFTAYYFGIFHDPWTFRFFPFELVLFIAGMCACRLYFRLDSQKEVTQKANKLSWFSVLIIEIFFLYVLFIVKERITVIVPGDLYRYIIVVFYILVAFLLPMLFLISKRNTVDRFIGELSYPVYLCHFIVIGFLQTIGVETFYLGYLSAIFTIGLSVVLYLLVVAPMDNFRHGLGKTASELR